MSAFFFNPSLHSSYCHNKEDDDVIDLGLSLKTLHPQPYYPSTQFVSEGYVELPEWSDQNVGPYPSPQPKASEECDEEAEGVQSKLERRAYVKVNMDGVVVGRKIAILDHADYFTLATQLEDMFGRLCISGLRLFQAESDFSLLYKDNKGVWRPVGDVPWKEFVECVKRLKIARKN